MEYDRLNPVQWHQAQGYARQYCARVFRDGGTPLDAIRAFGLVGSCEDETDWSKAVSLIADSLCQQSPRRAA